MYYPDVLVTYNYLLQRAVLCFAIRDTGTNRVRLSVSICQDSMHGVWAHGVWHYAACS